MMTRQDLERCGHKVQGTYRGPLDWDLCTSLCDDLQQARLQDGTHVFPLGALCIVRQDPGFNIVTVEVPKPVEMTPEDLVALRQRELRELAVEFGYELVEPGPDTLKYQELRRLFGEY